MARLDIEARAARAAPCCSTSAGAAGRSASWAARRGRAASRCCGDLLPRARARALCRASPTAIARPAEARASPCWWWPTAPRPRPDDRDEIAKWIERGGIVVRFAGPNLAERRRHAGAGAAARRRPRARRRHDAGRSRRSSPRSRPTARSPACRCRRTCASQRRCWPSRPRSRRQDLGAAGRRHAAGDRREARARLARAGPHHGQHRTGRTCRSPACSSKMLRRLVTLSHGVAGDGDDKALPPVEHARRLRPAGAAAARRAPIAGRRSTRPSRPGRSIRPASTAPRTPQRALNLGGLSRARAAACLPAGVAADRLPRAARSICALVPARRRLLLLLDLLLSLWLRGLLPRACAGAPRRSRAARRRAAAARRRSRRRRSASPPPAADEPGSRRSATSRRSRPRSTCASPMSRTGDPEVDDTSKAGLDWPERDPARRTAVEPASRSASMSSSDELAFYPLLYWPVTAGAAHALADARSGTLNRYLATGGTILFDTRDQHMVGIDRRRPSAAAQRLLELTPASTMPPLVPIPPDHVLTKSFYLLRDFPGRWIGGNGLGRSAAAAGSMTASPPSSSAATTGRRPGRPTSSAAAVPGDARRRAQREMADPLRRQHRDVCADRQLQGRPGARAGDPGTARAMIRDASSIAFDPLLPWPVLIAWPSSGSAAGAGSALPRRARGALLAPARRRGAARGPAQSRRWSRSSAADRRRRAGRGRPLAEPGRSASAAPSRGRRDER